MKITKTNLNNAVDIGILDNQQADALYTFLKSQPDSGPAFSFTNILYYLLTMYTKVTTEVTKVEHALDSEIAKELKT